MAVLVELTNKLRVWQELAGFCPGLGTLACAEFWLCVESVNSVSALCILVHVLPSLGFFLVFTSLLQSILASLILNKV